MMPERWMADLQLESKLMAHIARRDRLRGLTAAVLITTVVYVGGEPDSALTLLGILVCYTALGAVIYRRPANPEAPLPLSRICAIWILSVCTLTVFVYPAFILSHLHSTALLIAALTWLFGMLVHVSNTYAALPFYKWSMTIPPMIVAGGIILEAGKHDYVWSGYVDLFMAMGIMVTYLAHTYDTMDKVKDTLSQLNRAKDEANARLLQLEHLTRHDPLTGLMNRGAFEDHVQALVDASREQPVTLTVMLVDLDGFKPINDSYTHAAGDAILKAVGDRLTDLFDDGSVVARLGGDEFAVASTTLESQAECARLAGNIVDVLSGPVTFGTRELTVGCSVGVAQHTPEIDSAAQLLNLADQAMYTAKHDNTATFSLYDARAFPVRATLDDRAILLNAMARSEIKPYYQPKIDLRTGAFRGMEALARWEHPTKGLIMPGKFIPMINDLSLQGNFLFHTLRTSISDIEMLLAEGIRPGFVSVNLTEVTLATISGRDTLKEILSAHPATIPYLTFEVTEDVFIARSGTIIQESIKQFRRMGVRISLDDFGTGFASFQHLRELEFDELKLDTSFVQGLGRDKEAAVLVKAFLDIGRGLDVDVIAEGVENEVQRDILRDLGCESAQGFLFSKAIPIAAIVKGLKRSRAAPQPGSSAA